MNATLGFGILSRPRRFTPQHTQAVGFTDYLSAAPIATPAGIPVVAPELVLDDVAEPIGELDHLAALLSRAEESLEDSGENSPAIDRLTQRVATTGAQLIDARYNQTGNVESLTTQILNLTSELATMQHERANERLEMDALRLRVAAAQDELARALETDQERGHAIDHLSRTIFELESELSGSRTESAGLRREVETLRRHLTTVASALGDLRRERTELADQLEGARAQNDLLRVELHETQSAVGTIHAEFSSHIQTLASERKALAELVDARTLERDAHRVELEELQYRVAHAESELAEARAQLSESNEALDEQRQENELMEGWLNQALTRVADLESQLASYRHEDFAAAG